MSTETPQTGIDFDRAEFETKSAAPGKILACASCTRAIERFYYEVAGKAICDNCRIRLHAAFEGGSPGGRAFKAAVAGAIAGVVGAAIYAGIEIMTGYELGLIALLVGLLVGNAVRWGSRARGGWFYQALAILLTYVAISAAYLASAFSTLSKQGVFAEMEKRAATSAPASGSTASTAAADAPTLPSRQQSQRIKSIHDANPILALVVATVVLVGLALALPIMAGVHSPIGLFIVGIALYTAWKINRGRAGALAISGPYLVGSGPPPQPNTPAS